MFQLYQVWSTMNVMHYFCNFALQPTVSFCVVEARMEDIRFSDGGMSVFFFDPGILEAVAASQQTFLLSPAPIKANTRGGDRKM